MAISRCARAALAVAILLVAPSAQAQRPQQGFVLDRFEPSERGSSWFVLDSLDLRGHVRPAAGVVASWAKNPLVVYDRDGRYVSSLVGQQVLLHAGASMVLWSRVRLGLDLPVAAHQSGSPVVIGDKSFRPPGSAAGDLRISSDVRLFGEHGGAITGAVGLGLYLPTGSRADYTSDGTVRALPRVTLAGDLSIFTYSARGGFHYRPLTETFERNPLGSELVYGLAAGVRLARGKLVIGPELFGSSVADERAFLRRRGSPAEVLLGAHASLGDVRLGAGAGTGITRGWGTPELRTFFSAEWAPRLPRARRPDALATPTPTPRPDADGAVEAVDVCTSAVGCPADRDGDGVADAVDACPELAGVASDDPVANGCPPDRDGDGVADADDACPDAPGPASPDASRSGCPLARLAGGEIQIAEQVRFEVGSAVILRESDPTLLAVAATLEAHPEIAKLRVEGHTDSSGRAAANARLSRKRAQAVVDALVARGVARSRLEAVGQGSSRPLDTNATEAGRRKNRRVELHVEESASAAPSAAPR